MLRSVKDLEKCAIQAMDGNIGHVSDLYFDDLAWVIRYLVVDTGMWLSGRKVLMSPFGTGRPDWAHKLISVAISKDQVRNIPAIEVYKPPYRPGESSRLGGFRESDRSGRATSPGNRFHDNEGEVGRMRGGAGPGSVRARGQESDALRELMTDGGGDPHLRSCNVVMNFLVHASDGDIGRVCGLLIDEDTWAIRYLVVKTSDWWLGHKVVLAPEWIDDISWTDARLTFETTRQAVQEAPPYDSVAYVNRHLEIVIYHHYGRLGYWMSEIDREVSV